MQFAHFFVRRPIFASVVSILITIVGALAYQALPIEQYPAIAPPTIEVNAVYPGANAKTVAETVATPIEQAVNGVENMIYMQSQSTADGSMRLSITFDIGTDLDTAQVLVQNRVSEALPRLPVEVRQLGVTTQKNSPDLMMVINLYSPNDQYSPLEVANYAVLNLKDPISRINGVGSMMVFGASEYAMRIWIDPDLVNSYQLTAGEVVNALRAQNIQIAGGTLNQAPQPSPHYFEFAMQTQGRLPDAETFSDVIVKSEGGRLVRLKDVARVELAAQNYRTNGYLAEQSAIALPIFQRPGSNALTTADEISGLVEKLSKDFPQGIEYDIVYNPTEFIRASINKVQMTVLEAVVLVVLVIVAFLQTWRAAIIPILAIPISLIGSFAIMKAIGFSLNNLTLFGMVLAIGIVVDDAIVVIENMERHIREGMKPFEAALKSMTQVGSALIAMGMVLVAVFIPTAFIGGISGRFYQQFGLTVAMATAISVIVSLTLSPALAAMLLPPHESNQAATGLMSSFYEWFNQKLAKLSDNYAAVVAWLLKRPLKVVGIYLGLMFVTWFQFGQVPTGFIPLQDQGYVIVAVQLPSGAAISETDKVVKTAIDKILAIDGIENAVGFSGFSGATFTSASNAAAIFPTFASFEEREKRGLSADAMTQSIRMALSDIKEAFIVVVPPPPVQGIGNAGGFKMMIQDKAGVGLGQLNQATWQLAGAANQSPLITSAFTLFETNTPQLYLDIDRGKAERLNVPVSQVFEALEVYIGSAYINDFNYLGRTFQVIAQADAPHRLTVDDVMRIKVRSLTGHMVPIGSIANAAFVSGTSRLPRHNLYPSAALIGDTPPGVSSGAALAEMSALAESILPEGIGYEWTEIAYQQTQSKNTAPLAFTLAVLFVFLLLAAQYESLVLPFSIILIVPMCLLSAISGVRLAGMDNNIMTQIGFVILIGLASKNAILIVEFAKQLEQTGLARVDAIIEAARIRLRPILMTSFAFIFGVVPLVLATGPGAEMRQAIGVVVFSGMIGVTAFGLLFTPVFYLVCQSIGEQFKRLRQG